MISYLKHWHEWKKLRYPTLWVYQPLRDIREDLMGAYTLHVIRAALDLLEKLGFLSIRKNARQENRRNGQDKTHQYLLHEDRIEEALEKLYSSKEAKIRKNSPVNKPETSGINSRTPGINSKTSRFTVETHTQISSIDSCTNSCSLRREREEINFVPEVEVSWEDEDEVEQDLTTSFDDRPEISQEQEDSNKEQFFAVSASKCDEAPQTDMLTATCVEVVQTDVKPLPKQKQPRRSHFWLSVPGGA
jgi:CRISPR/Cas system-associated endonuclease/helicase Cas3